MALLLVAEHNHSRLNFATLHALTAAGRMAQEVHVLVAGWQCAGASEQAAGLAEVAKVLSVDAAHYADHSPENLAALLLPLVQSGSYSHVVAPAGSYGRDFLPRLAALLDVAPLSDVVAVQAPDTFVRPGYAGNVWATVQVTETPVLLTVRSSAFEPAPLGGAKAAPIDPLAAGPDLALSKVLSRQHKCSSRPELGSAKVVVAGGRGLGSAADFQGLLEPLADKLGAALGATRAAVDAGFVANEFQVGQTGKVVAPTLYLAVGLSGAIQHLAGMKESKCIIAINKDPEAPIFQVADYGLVGDLFQVVPELTAALSS